MKLAYGGQEWGNSKTFRKSASWTNYTANFVSNTVKELNLDGVDLVQEHGYGYDNMDSNGETSFQLLLLQYLREVMPDKIITYTFPGDTEKINFPFREIAQYGHRYLDAINVFRASQSAMDQLVTEFEVPKSKVCITDFYMMFIF